MEGVLVDMEAVGLRRLLIFSGSAIVLVLLKIFKYEHMYVVRRVGAQQDQRATGLARCRISAL